MDAKTGKFKKNKTATPSHLCFVCNLPIQGSSDDWVQCSTCFLGAAHAPCAKIRTPPRCPGCPEAYLARNPHNIWTMLERTGRLAVSNAIHIAELKPATVETQSPVAKPRRKPKEQGPLSSTKFDLSATSNAASSGFDKSVTRKLTTTLSSSAKSQSVDNPDLSFKKSKSKSREFSPLNFNEFTAPDPSPQHGSPVASICVDGKEILVTPANLRCEKNLGEGSFGVVDLMRHEPSGFLMAVKRIRLDVDDLSASRALMDLNVTRKARCPYLVQFYGEIFSQGQVWICMEAMDMSLDKCLLVAHQYMSGIPEIVLARIAFCIVSALDYLKTQMNVMHRDVKPSNMLINKEGIVKLCDYGIAAELIYSIAMTNIGTVVYMAPERVNKAEMAYDIRSDVWSLGVSMVELATGRHPYRDVRDIFQFPDRLAKSPPPCLPRGKFSSYFEYFVELCLQPEREKRSRYAELRTTEFVSRAAEADISSFAEEVIECRNGNQSPKTPNPF